MSKATIQNSLRALLPLGALMLALVGYGPTEAFGFAIINNGTVMLGVNDAGHLNTPDGSGPASLEGTTAVGLRFIPTGAEATAPGCLCEGWGAASIGLGVSGGASVDNPPGGVFGISNVSFSSTASTATSVVNINGGAGPDVLQVTHAYTPSVSPNLYQADVTIKNIGAGPAGDIRYRRVMDWDVEPTAFSEFVTIGGLPAANVLLSHNNGFDTSIRAPRHRPDRRRGLRFDHERQLHQVRSSRSRRVLRVRIRGSRGGRRGQVQDLLRRGRERGLGVRRARGGRRRGILARLLQSREQYSLHHRRRPEHLHLRFRGSGRCSGASRGGSRARHPAPRGHGPGLRRLAREEIA